MNDPDFFGFYIKKMQYFLFRELRNSNDTIGTGKQQFFYFRQMLAYFGILPGVPFAAGIMEGNYKWLAVEMIQKVFVVVGGVEHIEAILFQASQAI